jgi:uncharacterized membrane protein
MSKGRMEAFTDAVIAIIMTILVLELQPLTDLSFHGLWEIRTELLAYFFSFFILVVTWNNHHHMFQVVKSVSTPVLWTNSILLFWLSLFPFVTATVDANWESRFAELIYVFIYLMYNISWVLLRVTVVRANPSTREYIGRKDLLTTAWVIVVIGITWFIPEAGVIGCFIITIIWILPYKNVEKLFNERK